RTAWPLPSRGGGATAHPRAGAGERAGADPRAGMDLDPGEPAAEMRSKAPEPPEPAQPEPAREPVDVDRVEARIAGQYLPRRASRRVAVEDAGDIATQFLEHAAILWVSD